jgi:FixJ family two-component response regulator
MSDLPTTPCKHLIVIVDDDDGVRSATSNLLRALGHRVAAFATAEAFLKSEQLSATSCLLTDVQMPGMNGLELLERVKSGGHGFPVIVITAFPDDRVRDRAMQLGAASFLRKPFSKQSLTDCIESALKA